MGRIIHYFFIKFALFLRNSIYLMSTRTRTGKLWKNGCKTLLRYRIKYSYYIIPTLFNILLLYYIYLLFPLKKILLKEFYHLEYNCPNQGQVINWWVSLEYLIMTIRITIQLLAQIMLRPSVTTEKTGV